MSESTHSEPAAVSPHVWYLDAAGNQRGPVTADDLRDFLGQGLIHGGSMVWAEGMPNWKPMSETYDWARLPQVHRPLPGPGTMSPHAIPGYVPNNGNAIAALVLGISSLVLMGTCFIGILAGIPAVICGHMAIREIDNNAGFQGGRGMAIAGLVTGYLSILATVAVAIFFGMVMIGAASSGP